MSNFAVELADARMTLKTWPPSSGSGLSPFPKSRTPKALLPDQEWSCRLTIKGSC